MNKGDKYIIEITDSIGNYRVIDKFTEDIGNKQNIVELCKEYVRNKLREYNQWHTYEFYAFKEKIQQRYGLYSTLQELSIGNREDKEQWVRLLADKERKEHEIEVCFEFANALLKDEGVYLRLENDILVVKERNGDGIIWKIP